MSTAAFITDLIFATKVASTGRDIGAPVTIIQSLAQLDNRLAAGTDAFIIIDLNVDDVDALDAIVRCRTASHHPHIIAYASHVQAELIAAARQAGAHKVMSRSAFVAKLPDILAANTKQLAAREQSSNGGPT